MTIKEEMEKQGNWLFRLRSYLPFLLIPVFIYFIRNVGHVRYTFDDKTEDLFEGICIGISFFGLALRCIVSGYAPDGTSGRNTKGQYAKTLNTTGIYSLIRHPLYLGNFIIFFGIISLLESWQVSLMCTVIFWLYYERIVLSEEEFLLRRFGKEYLGWSKKTHALIPNFKNWQRPNIRFSFKSVIRREYSGFFTIVAISTLLEILAPIFTEGRVRLGMGWRAFFVMGLMIYLTALVLKTQTKLLNADRSIGGHG